MTNDIFSLERLLASLAPQGASLTISEPLQADEVRWFLAGHEAGIFKLQDCPEGCSLRRKRGLSWPDHFETPAGESRHLLSRSASGVASLNREYIPHLAAYSRVILDFGYLREHSSFSRYRTFTRDLITKLAGRRFETDAEFYDDVGEIYLQIEAKQHPFETERLAAKMSEAGSMGKLEHDMPKEIEYVLDLAPKYIWVVGPGSVDPAPYVFDVKVNGLNAVFTPRSTLPPSP